MQANSTQEDTFLDRVRATLAPGGIPGDDRGRMRMVVDNLILHLHPTKVPDSTLRFSYTWGLGGLSALLLTILIITGVLLEMNYTPNPPQAYLDILALRSTVLFGDLIRNLHHWSANLLLVTAVLHLLRVFLTGAYRPPRALNWLLGIAMLLLVVAANFTGYLLPWDQLAYWAITVGTGLLDYLPLIGPTVSRLLLGGAEVGPATLLNFYSLHISFIPIGMVILMSYHFWRVRKDGGLSIPKRERSETPKINRVTTIPHLVRRELVFALVWLAILFTWAMLVPAPLEGIADPMHSPNPAKAPWYFMGIQELLLHFHPLVGAFILPILALLGLAALPFLDFNPESVGVYFRSGRGLGLSSLAAGFAMILTPTWVLLDEFVLNWTVWLSDWPSLLSNGLVPLSLVFLGLFGIDEGIRRLFQANLEERVLFMVLFLFVSLIILTIVGIFFRGSGMLLVFPWNIPPAG